MLTFDQNPRLQRGRGLGGIFKSLAKLASPLISNAAKTAKTAIASPAAKRLVKSLKQQAVESGANILTDVIDGKNVGESLSSEFDNVKEKSRYAAKKALSNLASSNSRKRKLEPAPKSAKKRKKKKKNQTPIF